MLKSKLIALGLTAVIGCTSVPIGHISAMVGHVTRTYTERGHQYTAFATSDGSGWIMNGKKWKKNKKYAIIFNTHGTEQIEDDTVIKIICIR